LLVEENKMGIEIFKNDPLFFQRLMKGVGYYTKELDGDWGPGTEAAYERLQVDYERLRTTYGSFDAQTEGNIATLLPKAQEEARKFMVRAKEFHLGVKILSGTRTYGEQNALYEKGRTTPGPRVTNAKGGQSNHNFGIAFDVGIFDKGHYYTGKTQAEDKAYVELRAFTKNATKLDWGGDWKSIVDKPHYELHTGMSVAEVRGRLEAGTAYA
jgi:peptidoglycan L-alanyl-D-glutamate endopeptidase CwlK